MGGKGEITSLMPLGLLWFHYAALLFNIYNTKSMLINIVDVPSDLKMSLSISIMINALIAH
jgi:hypothetical protein